MSTNKSISYILCNKGIIVNLYKLHFPSFHFSLQPNKRVFHPPTFPPHQPNTQEGKPNIFYPPTFPSSHNFPSFYFFTPPTKRILRVGASVTWFSMEAMFVSFSTFFFPLLKQVSKGTKCSTSTGSKLHFHALSPQWYLEFLIRNLKIVYQPLPNFFQANAKFKTKQSHNPRIHHIQKWKWHPAGGIFCNR